MFQDFQVDTIKKTTYPNLIYDQIIESIKEGTLRPGDPLPSETSFVKQFDVGRTSVREALACLEYLNIIVARSGRYYVNENVQEYYRKKLLYHYGAEPGGREDVFVIRKLLEQQFAMLAAQRATTNDLKYMYQLLAAIGVLLRKGTPPADTEEGEEILDQYAAFHRALASSTQNSLLVRIFDRFEELMFFEKDAFTALPGLQRDTYILLQQITRDVENRDAAAAAESMRRYLAAVENAYNSETKGKG